jgi:hypothetical protein
MSSFLGFIRSIDTSRGEFHVVIPDRTISKQMINAFIKGQDDFPDEFYFLSIDRVMKHIFVECIKITK